MASVRNPVIAGVSDESGLAGACLALIGDVSSLSAAETDFISHVHAVPNHAAPAAIVRDGIRTGADPLGCAFARIRPVERRRLLGQTYTPPEVVAAMMSWATTLRPTLARVVDPGAGSGRYAIAAARAFPAADIIAVEPDPLSALVLRANIAVMGLSDRIRVVVDDYRSVALEPIADPTLFIGNPPYVRHHLISAEWKSWLAAVARNHGLVASGLSDLYAHFLLRTADLGRPGDYGAFITGSSWLDSGYGRLVRDLLTGELGGESIHVIDPHDRAFADAMVAGVVMTFRIGSRPRIMRMETVPDASALGALGGGVGVPMATLEQSDRWSGHPANLRLHGAGMPDGYVELGEIARVHRGAVTGDNHAWMLAPGAASPVPVRFAVPTVVHASDLISSAPRLESTTGLHRVIDLPIDLDSISDPSEREMVDGFLAALRSRGVPTGYVAAHRRAWWSVGLRAPAPILATYMARRPPVFVRNAIGARHVNIAHGIYPLVPMDTAMLDALRAALESAATPDGGRVYAGGLVKYEPGDMERIPVPGPDLLGEMASVAG